MFFSRVRQQRVARPVVEGGNPQGGKTCDIRPSQFRMDGEFVPRFCAHLPSDLHEFARALPRQAGACSFGTVVHFDGAQGRALPQRLVDEGANHLQRLVAGHARRKTVVDQHVCTVRNDISARSATDAHNGQGLRVGESVHEAFGVTEGGDRGDDGGEGVDRIITSPGARGVRGFSLSADADAQGSVAAPFDVGGGGFAEERQIRLKPLGVGAGDSSQAVEARVDFLVIVEDPGDVSRRVREGAGRVECDGDSSEHVDASAPAEEAVFPPGAVGVGDVVGDGNGVEVAGDEDARGASLRGAREHGVSVAQDFQVVAGAQCTFHRVRDALFVAAFRGNVNEFSGEGNGVSHGEFVRGDVHGVHGVLSAVSSSLSAPRFPSQFALISGVKWCPSRRRTRSFLLAAPRPAPEVFMTLDSALEARVLRWMEDDVDEASRAQLAALLESAHTAAAGSAGDEASRRAADTALQELQSAFAAPLAFGTAGLRGAMGPGPGRMNRAVVICAAYGLSQVLREVVGERFRVVIGFDARHHSDEFARDTAAVVTAAGGEALIMPHPAPTPVLAYALRTYRADAGVMVTASHNPARDNGYKVYLGGRAVSDEGQNVQIVAPWDSRIYEAMRQAPPARAIPRATEGWATLPSSIVDEYVQQVAASVIALIEPAADSTQNSGEEHLTAATTHPPQPTPHVNDAAAPLSAKPSLHLVTTAMHGVGGAVLDEVLRAVGFTDIHPVQAQQDPDPDFPTVSFPNPEEPGALDAALAQARRLDADLVLANDPDADRCSAAVPDASVEGGWRQLSGDEIGALLGDFIASRYAGEASAVLANSIVSSRLLSRIAESAGVAHTTTLTGFKWIARTPRMVFGYEEAIGFCVFPQLVRDKDGISASALLASYAALLSENGSSVTHRLDELALEHGVYATAPLTIRVDDLTDIARMMERLRSQGVSSLAGSPVSTVVDLARGWQHLPATDGMLFVSDLGDRVIVRPSGTEPKLKCYCEVVVPVVDGDLAGARSLARERMGAVIADMRRALGVQ